MTLKAVLDVNTLASAARSPDGAPGQVLSRGLQGEFIVAASEHILAKLDDVLSRRYFAAKVSIKVRQRHLHSVRRGTMLTIPDRSVAGICDDEEDDIVLGTAVAARADYLVTGDRGLLAVRSYGEVSIVTARQFLTLLEIE